MTILKEAEWNRINDLLLEVYSMDKEQEIADKFLKNIRILIPYSQGFFIMCDEDNEIIEDNSAFINISDLMKRQYIEHFYKVDYIKYILTNTSTVVFKDTDIMEDSLRMKTEVFQEFFIPQNICYGCGIIFIKEEKILGILNLFRAEDIGDFSDKDLRILHIVKDHLANIIYSLRNNSKSLDGRISLDFDQLDHYNLSKREKEIIKTMVEGASNQDISDKFMISISTVKKHVYNIFTKMGINSRMQLVKIFSKEK